MSTFKTLASLALLVATRLALVQASVYVTNPVQSTVCHAGQSCEVDWVDDGSSPLLSDIGECTVGLYNGEMVLVQSLTSVNVADTHSFSFTPDPSVGDNGGYYLVFTSTAISYQGWSGTFTLDGMTGSGSGTTVGGSSTSGGSSAITSSAVGSSTSMTTSVADSITGTVTASSYSTATTITTPISSGISSGFSTLTVPSTTSSGTTTHSTSSTATSATTSATQSGAAIRTGASTSLAGGLILAFAGALVF
ncbi:hypothetical protein DEU56DRAFT_98570 [Suillus clintonianus]|uniref:uncharacterized protein n=1 Tax=Suillus clintonianus TaxID=1904413 RepID=UPI001B877670|nr:uncharacterized protein DEU56DRAFT_98570 [Suillus clintonianus]KAG2121260.1 hypothetical protein DEU56DRAFT_98570 [Suillus clintonianus]